MVLTVINLTQRRNSYGLLHGGLLTEPCWYAKEKLDVYSSKRIQLDTCTCSMHVYPATDGGRNLFFKIEDRPKEEATAGSEKSAWWDPRSYSPNGCFFAFRRFYIFQKLGYEKKKIEVCWRFDDTFSYSYLVYGSF